MVHMRVSNILKLCATIVVEEDILVLIAMLECFHLNVFGSKSNVLILLEPLGGYQMLYLLQVHPLALVLEALEAWRPLHKRDFFAAKLSKGQLEVIIFAKSLQGELQCQILYMCYIVKSF